jgi:hypothetical protein
LPITNVTSVLLGSTPDLLTLTTQPVKVASVDLTIDGAGTLDAVNPENTDENFGADVRAGFSSQSRYTVMAGNLQGGSLDFSVSGDGGGGSDGGTGGGGGDIPGVPQPNDQDGDGVVDEMDAFPTNPDEATDTNNDGVGNNADPDDDSDGVVDALDAFPVDPAETTDTNGDGVGDNEDPDRDGDNVANDGDAFPYDPDEAMDTDDDGETITPTRMMMATMSRTQMTNFRWTQTVAETQTATASMTTMRRRLRRQARSRGCAGRGCWARRC